MRLVLVAAVVFSIIWLCSGQSIRQSTDAVHIRDAKDEVIVRVSWDGGEPCTNCTDGMIQTEPYACDFGGKGNWSDGEKYFQDPVSKIHPLIVQVKLNVYGRFNCDSPTTGANLIFLLNDVFIATHKAPKFPQGCSCPQCVVSISPSASHVMNEGWPGYRYGGLNKLSVIVDNGVHICLSYIDIILFLSKPPPEVWKLVPDSGPLTGGTVVTVAGQFPEKEYMCLFGDIQVPAVPTDFNWLKCITPPNAEGVYPFSLISNFSQLTYSTQHYFAYYTAPTLLKLEPAEGFCDGETQIIVHGKGFIDLETLRCNVTRANFAKYVNETQVLCFTPSITDATMIHVSISPNGQQYSNELPFYCRSHAESGGSIPGWIWVSLFFAIGTGLAMLLLYGLDHLRKKKQQAEEESNNYPDTPLLKKRRMDSDSESDYGAPRNSYATLDPTPE